MTFALVEVRDMADVRPGLSPEGHRSVRPVVRGQTHAHFCKVMLLGAVLGAHLVVFWAARLARLEALTSANTNAILIVDIPATTDQTEVVMAAEPQPSLEHSSATVEAPKEAEWSKVAVRVPPPSAPSTFASAAQSSPKASPGQSPSTGSSLYDPYAGVAPLRQSGPPSAAMTPPTEASTASLVLGQATADRLAAAVRRRGSPNPGRAQIRAHVAANGAVTRVDILTSTLSDRARIMLIDEARKLRFPSGPERWIVGTIDLG